MELNEAIELAKHGDDAAMANLARYYYDREEYDNAVVWAENSAKAGNRDGILFFRGLCNLLGTIDCELGDFAESLKHWERLEYWAQYSLEHLYLDGDERIKAQCDINIAERNKAFCYYCLQQYQQALNCKLSSRIEDVLLKGLCFDRIALNCGNYSLHQTAYQYLVAAEQDVNFFNSPKEEQEELIFTMAILALSTYYTFDTLEFLKPDLNRAVYLLQNAINVISRPQFKAVIEEHLARYKKGIFGGYRFKM